MNSPVGRKQILIAEENPTLAHMLSSQLQSEGYETVQAADGAAAWRLLHAHQPPALMIVDARLSGIDGPALCRRIRATPRLADLPVILMTVPEDSPSRLAGLEAGANDFLSKPWSKAELYARVRTLLALRAAQEKLARRQGQLDLLYGIGRELTATASTDETLALLGGRMARALGATGGSVVLVDAQGPKRKVAMDGSLAPRVTLPPVLNGIEQRVAAILLKTGAPLLLEDTRSHEGWAEIEGVRSLAAAPLTRHQRIRGWVSLTHGDPSQFDKEGLDLLTAAARQATVVIEALGLAERLQAERRRFAVLSYSMADAVIATDREGRILLTNPAGAALLGEPEGDLRGRSIRGLVDDETLGALFARVAIEAEPWGAEILMDDGRHLFASVSPVGEEADDGLVAVIEEMETVEGEDEPEEGAVDGHGESEE
jgi:PAS domain S-box-containing protein